MARRGATNARYQKGTTHGSTRRSASSLKPKRGAGQSAKAASAKGKGAKAAPKRPRLFEPLPTTPEIKKWRRIWWVLLTVGMVFVAAGSFIPGLREDPAAQRVILMVVLTCSLAAIGIDLFVIRNLRKQMLEEMSSKPKKSGGS